MRNVFKSSRGLVDLQSVMIGIVITGVLASFSFLAVVGVVRMTAVDQAQTNLRVLQTAAESYYTANDKYPDSISVLVDEDYLVAGFERYETDGKVCFNVDGSTDYPQTFTAGTFIEVTNDIYEVDDNNRLPALVYEGTSCFPAGT